MTADKIQFDKEKETMLMTLSGRAIQSQWKNPILPDPWAEEAMRHIDYDLGKQLTGVAAWPMWRDVGPTVIATRAATLDMLTTRFLSEHPDAVVLQVGCGMDSRAFRVSLPAGVTWFDVDFPDVIDLRRQLFPARENYHMIGAPLDDLRWLAEVPRGRPGLLIAEGVFHYLAERDVKALLNAVAAHFPGGEVIFDICNTMIVKQAGKNVGGTGATYRWGLDDPGDIRQLEPKLELVKEFKPSELVAFSRFPFWLRAMFRLMETNLTLRRNERVVAFRY